MAQSRIQSFLKPSDTLNIKRQKAVFVSEAAFSAISLIGLNQLWYADYPRSQFHFINDNEEWLQMDKLGHLYSSYHLGRLGSEMLQWSGASPEKQLVYGAGLGFAFLTAVEVLDGFSSQWGASSGDVIANATGTALYVSQQLLWKEQRITPKFSFHTTRFAAYRPEVLGSSFSEQILKDYNGQTYWLSANLKSFFKETKIPKILNIAIGYGADGMLTGKGENSVIITGENQLKSRQFYLSLDLDLTKIETKSHFLKTFFSVFSVLKIPAPTLEYSVAKGVKGHVLYF
ncbi:Predicted lipoprotein [Flavobacterium glycines]|uniref:DUF2279 domain-containing protein n=1 Tax=Flavobacterium glycines TaxID=551990 RepID=A0A1B9DWU0_9FLAO|nr:DUF2279 domain-containing protein [Flavobacterium glycines]OCB74132.1 hypothetical protein FBGL_03005 [Flavobacterium glycines]GEL09551.1 DUF2279 domain-containing protein [Flavobacterium glycines]SDJ02759.1 Predicted lipoprotein [Flavobacterium glycines]